MSKKSQREKELHRLVALGRPVSAIRKDTDESGREYHIAATLRKVEDQYHVLIDFYYPIGTTGETIREEGKAFSDLEQAIGYLEEASGIPVFELRA